MFQAKWIIFLGIVFVLLAVFGLLKNNVLKPQQQKTSYATYQNSDFGFSIAYPKEWSVRTDTQIFENGDIVAFWKKGSTQKMYTEFTDGAQVAVSKPFTIHTNLTTWVRDNFRKESKFSKFTLGKYPFESVYECANLGCMTYYFTTVNGQIYGIATFAEGTNAEKMVYENAIVYILKSLKFIDTENTTLSKEDAVAKVKTLAEVKDYLMRVPNGLVAVNGEENGSYLIQVYEVKNDHTATFNWYTVNKITGEAKKEF